MATLQTAFVHIRSPECSMEWRLRPWMEPQNRNNVHLLPHIVAPEDGEDDIIMEHQCWDAVRPALFLNIQSLLPVAHLVAGREQRNERVLVLFVTRKAQPFPIPPHLVISAMAFVAQVQYRLWNCNQTSLCNSKPACLPVCPLTPLSAITRRANVIFCDIQANHCSADSGCQRLYTTSWPSRGLICNLFH